MTRSNENIKFVATQLVEIVDQITEIVGKEIDVFGYVASHCRPLWSEEDIATLVDEVRAIRAATKNRYKENQKVFLASTGDCGTLSAAIITKISDDDMTVVKSDKCWMTGKLSTSRFTASVQHWQKNQIGVYSGLPVLYWGHRNTNVAPEKYVILSNFYQLDEARGEVSA